MLRLKSITDRASAVRIAFVVMAAVALIAPSAHAKEASSEESASLPCAIVTEFAGDVEVMDPSRTHLLPVGKRSAVPCGGWVSALKGAVQLRHRDGYKISLAEGTFAQFPENNVDGKYSGDLIVLFRGETYVQAGGSAGEARVITANARARIRNASAIVLFNQADEETQLVTLHGSAGLENRFQTEHKLKIAAGEASSLNFKLLRVLPSSPRAVSIAALKEKFDALLIPQSDRESAVHAARTRQERVFASKLVKDEEQGEAKRGVASVKPAAAHSKPNKHSYSRAQADADRAMLHKHMVDRMVAGEKEGDRILYPNRFHGRARKASVQVIDVEAKRGGGRPTEDAEKKRLIEELSRIREE